MIKGNKKLSLALAVMMSGLAVMGFNQYKVNADTLNVAAIEQEVSGSEVNVKIGNNEYTTHFVLTITVDGMRYEVSGDSLKLQNCVDASIDNYTIPDKISINNKEFNVVGIESKAFQDCNNLKSITIPNSITYIASEAFEGCDALSEITIPSSVKEIGIGSFFECKNLQSVNIQDGVEKIDTFAFLNCKNLSEVTIPDSVTEIGSDAFSYKNDNDESVVNSNIKFKVSSQAVKTLLLNLGINENQIELQ